MIDVEKVKFLKNAKEHLSSEQYARLLNEFGLDGFDIEPRIRGLRAEDEFQLILCFLNCCDSVIGQDQSLQSVVNSTMVAPDLLCKFKMRGNNFVEIKSTQKSVLKFSKSDLERRKKFAESHGHPLLIAVKMKGFWGLFTLDYLEKNNLRVEIKDFVSSSLEEYTDSKTFLLMPGISLRSTYSRNGKLGIKNANYGELETWEIGFEDKVLKISEKSDISLMYSMVLEFLHDYLSNKNNIATENSEGKTEVTEILTVNLFIQTHNAFLSMIPHIVDSFGERYSYSTYLKEIKTNGREIPIKPIIIESIFEELFKIGIPILCIN